jgi:hypothetical protein
MAETLASTRHCCLQLLLATVVTASAAGRASADITIQTGSSPVDVHSVSYKVAVTVSSTYALQSVHAQVENVGADLVLTSGSWGGTLSLNAIGYGSHTLTYTATDVTGASATATLPLFYDLPPVLHVTAPVQDSVARTSLRVAATCSDDGPDPCSIEVRYGLDLVSITVKSSLDQIVDLSRYDSQETAVYIDAVDSSSQKMSYGARIYVDSTSTLREVEELDGTILDADCRRALVYVGLSSLKLYDRMTHQYTDVAATSTAMFDPGARSYLTRGGAIFRANGGLYQFERNQLALVDSGGSGLTVAGDYALWWNHALIVRDLVSETNTVVDASPMVSETDVDVGPNGDVAFSSSRPFQIYRWRHGDVTSLTAPGATWNFSPRTDGISVAYLKGDDSRRTTQSALFTNGAEITLDPGDPSDVGYNLRAGADYQVNAGWTAYTMFWSSARQVYLRDPAGTTQRLTQFGLVSTVDAMDSAGGVMMIVGDGVGNARRYFASPSVAPVKVSGWPGRAVSIGGTWHLILGRSHRPDNYRCSLRCPS